MLAGTWYEEQTIEHDGLIRYYRYYVPDDLPTNHPVLFQLHGGGGSMRKAVSSGGTAEWPSVADDHKFLLIIPNGVNIDTGDTSSNDQHWNDCRGDAILSNSTSDDVGFISALIDWADANFDIDLERVYTTGASNGGMMSYRLAFELGHRIAAIAAFIASIPAASECYGPFYPTPVLIINGDGEDNYMPWDGGCILAKQGCERGTVISALETRNFWIDFNACNPESVETIDYPDIDPNDGSTVTSDLYTGGKQGTEVMFYRVREGGHTVPSINHPRNPLILKLLGLGNHNHDIESAREAWDFLSRHRLKGTGTVNPGATFLLRVQKNPDSTLQLTWFPDCGSGNRYGIYRGDLNVGCSSITPEPGMCAVDETTAAIPEGLGSADFFLVVPNDSISEGSYGIDSTGLPRLPSDLPCYSQNQIDECAP